MTITGWIFMIGSVSTVLAVVVWCYRKVLTLPPEE